MVYSLCRLLSANCNNSQNVRSSPLFAFADVIEVGGVDVILEDDEGHPVALDDAELEC